jgi:hypothetical protein
MSPQLRLNLVEGSVSFNFSPQAAQDLQMAIAQLMERSKLLPLRQLPQLKLALSHH